MSEEEAALLGEQWHTRPVRRDEGLHPVRVVSSKTIRLNVLKEDDATGGRNPEKDRLKEIVKRSRVASAGL